VTRHASRPAHLKGTRHLESNRIIGGMVDGVAAPASGDLLGEVHWGELDPARLPRWIETLRESEQQLRQLRARLEAVQAGDERRCQNCGQPLAGRTDRRFCNATCRQRARRASRLEP
jgi:hypothetical protein